MHENNPVQDPLGYGLNQMKRDKLWDYLNAPLQVILST